MHRAFVKHNFSILLLLMAAPGFAAPMGLREVLQYGMEHSPKIKGSALQDEVRQFEYQNARAGLLPTLDLKTNHGLKDQRPRDPLTTNAPYHSDFNLSLTEKLYDNGESWTRLSIAELDQRRGNLDRALVKETVALDIVRSYLQLSLSQLLLEVRKQQSGLLKTQFRSFDQQYRQGLKTKRDFVRLNTQVQRADIEQLSATREVEKARLDLLKNIGAETNTPLEFALETPDPKSAPQTLPATTKITVEQTLQHQINQLEDQSNEKTVDISRRKYGPEVSLTSGIAYATSNYWGPESTPYHEQDNVNWYVLLGLNYTLWDWGTRRRDVGMAERKRMIRSQEIADTENELAKNIRSIELTLQQQQENLKLSQELVKLEESNYQFLEAEYRQGRMSYLDIITSLEQLRDARLGFYTAYFSLKDNLMQYKFYEGKLYDSLAAH